MNEILDELIVASEKMGNLQFRDALQKCKNETNKKILLLLQKFNQDYIRDGGGREFVEIKDFAIDIQYLVSLKKRDTYDLKNCTPVFQIAINDDTTEKLINCNMVVEYCSVISRDNEYDNLKEKLRSANVVFL